MQCKTKCSKVGVHIRSAVQCIHGNLLSAVSVSLEAEPQLHDVVVELALESMFP